MKSSIYLHLLLEKILESNYEILNILKTNYDGSDKKIKINEEKIREIDELANKKFALIFKKLNSPQN